MKLPSRKTVAASLRSLQCKSPANANLTRASKDLDKAIAGYKRLARRVAIDAIQSGNAVDERHYGRMAANARAVATNAKALADISDAVIKAVEAKQRFEKTRRTRRK